MPSPAAGITDACSSYLAAPHSLTRYPVNVVFHGHAHGGSPEGRTRSDVPVFNVALPLLQRVYPDRPSIRTVELPS